MTNKKRAKKTKSLQVNKGQKQIDKIVEQAKLLATGKIRSVYELEMAARELIAIEKQN